jgi:hypothetical protein
VKVLAEMQVTFAALFDEGARIDKPRLAPARRWRRFWRAPQT